MVTDVEAERPRRARRREESFGAMDAVTERALRGIDEAVVETRRLAAHPVVLGATYLQAVRAIENLPDNQPGSNKTWVERAQRNFRAHLALARPG